MTKRKNSPSEATNPKKKSSKASSKLAGEPKDVIEPKDEDVLFGRGDQINRHLGNRRFRELVENKKRAYLSSDFKREKRTIADSIVSAVRNLSPPGRFLAKDPRTGAWELVDDNRARDKTSQALREKAKTIRAGLDQEIIKQHSPETKETHKFEAAVQVRPPAAAHRHTHFNPLYQAHLLQYPGVPMLYNEQQLFYAPNPYCAWPPVVAPSPNNGRSDGTYGGAQPLHSPRPQDGKTGFSTVMPPPQQRQTQYTTSPLYQNDNSRKIESTKNYAVGKNNRSRILHQNMKDSAPQTPQTPQTSPRSEEPTTPFSPSTFEALQCLAFPDSSPDGSDKNLDLFMWSQQQIESPWPSKQEAKYGMGQTSQRPCPPMRLQAGAEPEQQTESFSQQPQPWQLLPQLPTHHHMQQRQTNSIQHEPITLQNQNQLQQQLHQQTHQLAMSSLTQAQPQGQQHQAQSPISQQNQAQPLQPQLPPFVQKQLQELRQRQIQLHMQNQQLQGQILRQQGRGQNYYGTMALSPIQMAGNNLNIGDVTAATFSSHTDSRFQGPAGLSDHPERRLLTSQQRSPLFSSGEESTINGTMPCDGEAGSYSPLPRIKLSPRRNKKNHEGSYFPDLSSAQNQR